MILQIKFFEIENLLKKKKEKKSYHVYCVPYPVKMHVHAWN